MLLMLLIVLVLLLTEDRVVEWLHRRARDRREHRMARRRAARQLKTQNARARCQELGVCPRVDAGVVSND